MKRTCDWCGVGITHTRADARFCTGAHRVAAHRATKENPIPKELTQRNRWIRRNSDKIPLTTNGDHASSTNPATWTNYAAATASKVGAGLGFVLGDGIGCIDLDHCLNNGQPTPAAKNFLTKYPTHFIEISPSGDGLHIWGLAEPAPGTRKTISGLNIERYSTGRYITITGNTYQPGTLLPL